MNQFVILPDSERNESRLFFEDMFPELGNRSSFPFNTTYRTLRHDVILNREVLLKRDFVRETLRKYLFRRLLWSPSEREANSMGFITGEAPRTYSPLLDKLARFIIAVGGGASLILPVLIMLFNPSSLITLSVAVVLFALSLSLGFETENKDTLTATATYAAVLVVFVGTTGAAP